jgi:hypothetical protein
VCHERSLGGVHKVRTSRDGAHRETASATTWSLMVHVLCDLDMGPEEHLELVLELDLVVWA